MYTLDSRVYWETVSFDVIVTVILSVWPISTVAELTPTFKEKTGTAAAAGAGTVMAENKRVAAHVNATKANFKRHPITVLMAHTSREKFLALADTKEKPKNI